VPAFAGFSASANAGGFYQSGKQSGSGSVVSEGAATSAYHQEMARMMRNQTYHPGHGGYSPPQISPPGLAGANNARLGEQSDGEYLPKVKKTKGHLKKSKKKSGKKGQSRLKERYDDVYDPDSEDDGGEPRKQPRMRNAQRFHSI
jgi:hypothetical protein